MKNQIRLTTILNYQRAWLSCMSCHGQVFRHGQLLLNLLEACSSLRCLDATKCLHALSTTMGPIPKQSAFIHNNIISSYISHGEVIHARKVFDALPQRTVVTYNTLITAYSRRGDVGDAWNLLSHMRRNGFAPTQYTLTGLLSCELLNLSQGVQLQALSIRIGLFDADAFVGTALLGLFGRHGCWDEMFLVFEDMPQKSLVTWNSMVSLLARNGFVDECKVLFRYLVGTGMSLSEGSFVSVLSGLFDSEEDLEYGELIHGLMVKCGFSCEVTAVNSLISMYVKCKSMFAVERLFEQVPIENVVSWNTVIDALVKSERPMMALELFLNMSRRGVMPSQATFVAVINLCTSLRSLVCGESVHAKCIQELLSSKGEAIAIDSSKGVAMAAFGLRIMLLLAACLLPLSLEAMVRHYNFNVAVKNATKLCSTKPIVTINGKFPGPTIYAREDDTVLVK